MVTSLYIGTWWSKAHKLMISLNGLKKGRPKGTATSTEEENKERARQRARLHYSLNFEKERERKRLEYHAKTLFKLVVLFVQLYCC